MSTVKYADAIERLRDYWFIWRLDKSGACLMKKSSDGKYPDASDLILALRYPGFGFERDGFLSRGVFEKLLRECQIVSFAREPTHDSFVELWAFSENLPALIGANP